MNGEIEENVWALHTMYQSVTGNDSIHSHYRKIVGNVMWWKSNIAAQSRAHRLAVWQQTASVGSWQRHTALRLGNLISSLGR